MALNHHSFVNYGSSFYRVLSADIILIYLYLWILVTKFKWAVNLYLFEIIFFKLKNIYNFVAVSVYSLLPMYILYAGFDDTCVPLFFSHKISGGSVCRN